MQKSNILLTAIITTLVVGIINSSTAIIAYELLVPEPVPVKDSLITESTSDKTLVELPVPDQNETPTTSRQNETTVSSTIQNRTSVSNTGQAVEFRDQSAKLVAGASPKPTAITTNENGAKVYQWCSGVNPNLPDEVCQAIINIAANPTESNPHLGAKAKQSLSLLPSDSSITMDESSWQSTSDSSGTMIVNASTPLYGDLKLKIFLEKQNNIWVLTDGQLA